MSARFQPGERVRVKVGSPLGHFRTPSYIQGRIGVVRAVHGEFANPESMAHGGDGLPKESLYLVCFHQVDVWEDYRGQSQDTVYVDLYGHWLEPL